MSIHNGVHEYCIDACIGCEYAHSEGHTTQYYICTRYLEPKAKWRTGVCSSATHLGHQITTAEKKRAGQQHQKKGKGISKKQQETYKKLI